METAANPTKDNSSLIRGNEIGMQALIKTNNIARVLKHVCTAYLDECITPVLIRKPTL